eukprot:gene7638-588_t
MLGTYAQLKEFLNGEKARQEQLAGKRIDCYRLSRCLGHGAFAKVYAGRHPLTNDEIAIKRIRNTFPSATAPAAFNEASLLSTLEHPNIIYLFQVIETPTETSLILELCKSGTLTQAIALGISLTDVSSLFRQLGDAVSYMHESGIAHRDIKADNVLLASPRRAVLADFGFAVHFHKEPWSTTYCGSLMYCAPEILLRRPYQPDRADIWAMGVLLSFMIYREYSFTPEQVLQWCQADFNKIILTAEDLNLRSWLSQTLQISPEHRKIELKDTDLWIKRRVIRQSQESILLASMSKSGIGRDVMLEEQNLYSSRQAIYRLYRRQCIYNQDPDELETKSKV